MAIVPGLRRGFSSRRPPEREQRTPHDEAHDLEIQARPPHGREYLGPQQEPDQPARLWSRSARSEEVAQAFRLWHAASCQAEAERLLRQHYRAAVPRLLQGSLAQDRRYRRADDRASGTPSRFGRVPRQIRAYGL